MRPRRNKIKQLDPLPTNTDPKPTNPELTNAASVLAPMNNDSAMTETKIASSPSPPPPSPAHPPPHHAASPAYSRFAYLCLDPTYTPDPYNRSLRWAYFMEESTATLHIAQASIDTVGMSHFKFTVTGNMEPASPEIVQRYASIVYTGSIYRQAYFPAQIPMVEAPVFAAASSSSAYVPPSSNPNPNPNHNHNPTPTSV